MTLPNRSHLCSLVLASLVVFGVAESVRAASVGASGYTNSFATAPVAADWSTASRTGGNPDIASLAQMDAAVQATAPGTIATALTSVATDPPPELANARHCSGGSQYVQTQPTGVACNYLMCTLVNGTGINAGGARISYDFLKVGVAGGEDLVGHVAYFRHATHTSWTPIPAFTGGNNARLTADLSFGWAAGSTVYILWADDNAAANPDNANQIDNFSAVTLPVVPLTITNQPQSQTVNVGATVTFTVGVSGSGPAYQWQRNNGAGGSWVNLAGATAASYTINNAQVSHSGQYRVVITNLAGTVTSQAAVLVVNQDTTGPIMLSAVVSETGQTNQITITFDEKLNNLTVNPPAGSNNFAVFARSGNMTNRVAISNTFYNGNPGFPTSFAVIQVGGPNWNITSNAYNGTISYFIVVNNVRDSLNNVIAPNSVIGVGFPNNLTTNVISFDAPWEYHQDWGNPFNEDPTIYTQPWKEVSYITATNGHWGLFYGIGYKDTLIDPSTYVPCRGTLIEAIGYVHNPTLVRNTFVWPTNLATNVTVRLSTVADDGYVAYINGVEIRRENVAGTGMVNENTRTIAEYVNEVCTSNNFANVALRHGTNVFAAAVCQSSVIGANGGDIYWGARLDIVQTSLRTGPVPPDCHPTNFHFRATKVGTNQIRLTWTNNPLSATTFTNNNIYNYTVEYTTNTATVGTNPARLVGPWYQLQPGVSNGLTTNFIPTHLPYIMRLHKVP